MSDSKTYHVLWEIDLAAESAKDAAEQALRIQRDPESIATFFDVTDEAGPTEGIDLEDANAASACARQSTCLSKSDWTEIFYAVELKRLHVGNDNRKNGRFTDDGVDLDAWHRQMEHIADKLGPDGERMHQAITNLIESADRIVSRWAEADLQLAVQDLDRALTPFLFGTRRGKTR